MNYYVYLRGWTDDGDLPNLDVTELTPSNLEKLFASVMPALQKLIFNIIIALIIYIIGRKLIGFLLKLLDKFLKHTSIDTGVSTFLMSAAKVILYVVLVFMVVGQLGVNTASIVTILGAAGLAISMSLQGSLANLAGGILILLMKPFKVGDYVSTSYGDGTVRAIGLVYTMITTVDNRALTIPNGTLSNSAVFNASAMTERRLDAAVGISYDSDLRKAKEVMEQVYLSCPSVLADKGVNVHVSSLGDSAVMIEAFGWVPASEYLSSKWYITEEIKLRFDEEGIMIPYPQLDVHLDRRNEPEGLPDRIAVKE